MSRNTASAILLLLTSLPAAGVGQEGPLVEIALEDLERIERQRPPTGMDLLIRNLSRYFAQYLVPDESGQLLDLLVSVEALGRDFALRTLQMAGDGQGGVVPGGVSAAAQRLLPRSTNPYREVMFFPGAAGGGIAIETYDLEAFLDTGLPWQALLGLAQAVPAIGKLPMSKDAAKRLMTATGSYQLLLLRVAGDLAEERRDPHLTRAHLARATEYLNRLAAGTAPAPPPTGQAVNPIFADVTGESGIGYRHVSSEWISRFRRYGTLAPTYSGGGVTAGDLDGDGWEDLLFCGGGGCVAYRNLGDGRFEEVTTRLGIGVAGEARMAVIADLDNDGWRDLFITYGQEGNRLFRNAGGSQFEDVTSRAGVHHPGDISGPAIAFDADADSLLDLYVGNFGNYLAGESPFVEGDSHNGMANRLLRNGGSLRFADATQQAGVGDTGWTQALSHADLDRDGDQDIYVANDFGRNELYLNEGDGTFLPAAASTGTDDPFHGMNVAFSDLNGDLRPDFYVTNIWFWKRESQHVVETNSLFLSRPVEEGVRFERYEAPGSISLDMGWSWAALFVDVDHDTDDDLIVVNGFTDYWTAVQYHPRPDGGAPYPLNNGREDNLFLRNDGGLPLLHLPDSGIEMPGSNARGLALLDYDLDGDLDAAVSAFHQPARLFRNDAAKGRRHWSAIELIGDPAKGVNRDAIGGEVIVHLPDGVTQWRSITGGEGYLSMSSLPVEFGLGEAETFDVTIRWPGGRHTQTFHGLPADRRIRVIQ